MHADTAFWDRIAPRYAKSPIRNTDAYETTLARIAAHLSPDMTVLELGCGTGSTALRLAPFSGRYIATDLAPGMIAIARDKIATAGVPDLRAEVGGIADGGHSPDAVLALNLLHLVADIPAALRTIHAMLPVGGLFVSKTPCLGGQWYLRPVVGALRLVRKAPAVTFVGVADLDAMIADAGFQIVETGLYPPSTPSRFVVARKVDRPVAG